MRIRQWIRPLAFTSSTQRLEHRCVASALLKRGFILAFSPDGSELAVALDSGGIRVVDVAGRREIMADRDFTKPSYGVTFGPDGALYASGWDGFLRRYGRGLQRTAKVAAHGGKLPSGIAVAPSGQRLAVGFYDDKASVDIFDADTLHRIASASMPSHSAMGFFSTVWMRGGEQLVAGGTVEAGAQSYGFIRSWSPDGHQVRPDVPVANAVITSFAPCGEAAVFATSEPSFGLLRADGEADTLQKGRALDARLKLGEAFAISADATRVRFGLGFGNEAPVAFDLNAGTLRDAPSPIADLMLPDVTGLAVADWKGTYRPFVEGKLIRMGVDEESRSLAVRADRAGFALGTGHGLRAYSAHAHALWAALAPAGV
jgi:hypothetical protein